MAGRYQGSHIFNDEIGRALRSIEIIWQANGWFWRPSQYHGDAVGPFNTSSEAFQNAKAAHDSRERNV